MNKSDRLVKRFAAYRILARTVAYQSMARQKASAMRRKIVTSAAPGAIEDEVVGDSGRLRPAAIRASR